MGKIMGALAFFLAVPAAASAQDFGIEWLDRVTHERMQERGPLKPQPVEWTLSGGLVGYLDNNVFLADKDGKTPGDAVVIPFVRARMDYTEQRFEASMDLLLDYKGYLDTNHDPSVEFENAQDWEQRFYGHARYVDARWTIGLDEILRHESDPSDAVFLNRVRRTISDTVGRLTYDLTRVVAFEAHGDYQLVRFEDSAIGAAANNDNYRIDAAVVYRQATGYDWIAQAGWMSIYYNRSQQNGAPPDADGYYVRGGFRGEPIARLSIEALAGWITVSSDRYFNTTARETLSTADIAASIRYDATETVRVTADYSRTIGFSSAGDGSPFQVVNRFGTILTWECTEQLTVRARWQWDHVVSALGLMREYQSLGISGSFAFSENFSLEAGGTYRFGNTHGAVVSPVDFTDAVGHLGVVLTY